MPIWRAFLSKVQCNSSNLDLNFQNSSFDLWSKTPGDCHLDLEPRASCYICRTPSAEGGSHDEQAMWQLELTQSSSSKVFPGAKHLIFPINKKTQYTVTCKDNVYHIKFQILSGNTVILSFELTDPAFLHWRVGNWKVLKGKCPLLVALLSFPS